jgi:hypothetical protein
MAQGSGRRTTLKARRDALKSAGEYKKYVPMSYTLELLRAWLRHKDNHAMRMMRRRWRAHRRRWQHAT